MLIKTFSFHHTNILSDESPSRSTNQCLCLACTTKISSPFTFHKGWGINSYTWDKGEGSKEGPLPCLIREILLIKEALSSVQFAAIIAIKKAFSLLPHLTSQLIHSLQQWWAGC